MGRSTRIRAAKACDICHITDEDTLFRIRKAACYGWLLACKRCQLQSKATWHDYRYGGTWKRHKRN